MVSLGTSHQIMAIAIVWLVAIVIVARCNARSGGGSTGLPLAFLITLSFLHCGALAYAVPGYSHIRYDGSLYLQSYDFTEETVLRGTYVSLLGVTGFSLGAILLRGRTKTAGAVRSSARLSEGTMRQILTLLAALGIAGFVLTAWNIEFPMAQALFQVLRNLAVTTVCLGPAMLLVLDRRSSWQHWLVAAAAIPIVYVVVWGFTSYGFITFSIFASFWLCVIASRRIGPVSVTIGSSGLFAILLSAFVAWMSLRDRIREAVWGGADMGERLSVIAHSIAQFEVVNPLSFAGLDSLNTRFNHNIFVGKVLEWHDQFPDLKMHGENFILIPFALIPRALWPDKPEMGGSEMLETHTGMTFATEATFGAGPIVEFYVNFGLIGVFVGMALLGLVLRWIDLRAAGAVRSSDMLKFALWFTVGISFVAPLTELFFMFNGAMMAFLVLSALLFAVRPKAKIASSRGRSLRAGMDISEL